MKKLEEGNQRLKPMQVDMRLGKKAVRDIQSTAMPQRETLFFRGRSWHAERGFYRAIGVQQGDRPS
jgi:hypothetical protein